MIRIDEIYNNTFWPWLKKNKPGTRMFFCDPPGNTDPCTLLTLYDNHAVETDYVFFHDQEPIQLDTFAQLFDEVFIRNISINVGPNSLIGTTTWQNKLTWPAPNFLKELEQHLQVSKDAGAFFHGHPGLLKQTIKLNPQFGATVPGHVVVSELGQHTDHLTDTYGWKCHYYFYHAWACLDWFRGYDKTFLIARARDREPKKTFMSPNRIVGGQRDHRVLFLYHVFKNRLDHNHVSAPKICPYEKVDISNIAHRYSNTYNDIEQVFAQAILPKLFVGEQTQLMTSCWLGNFSEAQDSLFYVPTETVYFGPRKHITEKTFKAIALEMPFILVAPAGSLEYLREYGFKTFASVIDESYDLETNDIKRLEKVSQLLQSIDNLSMKEKQQIHKACLPMVEYNFNHFYQGGLAAILWRELNIMLAGLCV